MHARELEPGTPVGVHLSGLSANVGIVSDARDQYGLPLVIAPAGAVIAEQTWQQFTGGRPAQIYARRGQLPGTEVVRRARSKVGQAVGFLRGAKFAEWAHGLDQRDQTAGWPLVGLAFLVVIAGALALSVEAPPATARRPA